MADIQVLELTNGGSFDRDNGISNRVVFMIQLISEFPVLCVLKQQTFNKQRMSLHH